MTSPKTEQAVQPEKVKDDFHNRFMEVLCTKPVAWWSEQLNVVPSLINARWKKGSYPNADNLIKICFLSGISANWLLLGVGPKHIESKEMDEDTRRTLQTYITSLEDQNEEITAQSKKILDDVEVLKILKWFSKTFHTDTSAPWGDQLKALNSDAVFQRILMPNYILTKMLIDLIFKGIEHYASSENGQALMATLIDWFRENYDKNLDQAQGSLKALDQLFETAKVQAEIQSD